MNEVDGGFDLMNDIDGGFDWLNGGSYDINGENDDVRGSSFSSICYFRRVIYRTCHVTRPIWRGINWPAGPKICIVGLSFAEQNMDKTVHLKFYLPLSGRCKHQLQENIQTHWLVKDKWNLHG